MFQIEQFDRTIRTIAEYVVAATPADLTEKARDGLVLHYLDSIGCALGSFRAPVCGVVLDLANAASTTPGASVVGLEHVTTPELATFANATLVRYLDYNDTYITEGGGHTSDLISAAFAAAEQLDISGEEFVLALHVGYETFAALADAVPLRARGWDNPCFMAIAAAAAASKAMRLTVEQVANAISMAITPSMSLGITRVGPLANWKALAAPMATMSALFATRLASRGITGPPHAIEGYRGLWQLATQPFDISRIGRPLDGRSAVERNDIKLFVAEYNAQGPVGLFVDLYRDGLRAGDIEEITVHTYEVSWSEIGGGQDDHDEKWDPQNKETADHSLPYMIAVAIADGEVNAHSYDQIRILDPSLRPLMNRISVVVAPDISANWVLEPANRIDITLRTGEQTSHTVPYMKGHHMNPAMDDEVINKFRTQADELLGSDQAASLLSTLQSLPTHDRIGELGRIYRSLDIRT